MGGSGAKIMAKSSRRRKQDRARIEGRHAQEARRRDEAEAKRRADELFERAADTALAPAALAALIMGELAGSTGTGLLAHTRLRQGAQPATLAETARLLLGACPDPGHADGIPPGVLAFVAVAAHANGDEEEEGRCTEALLDLARAAGDEGLLKVAADVVTWTHPDKATEIIERYLLDHPRDHEAYYMIWTQATGRTEELAIRERFGSSGPVGLVDPGDPSDPRYGERLVGNMRRAWEADPQARDRFQARAKFQSEILRRQIMPPWQAERLRRAERAEADT
jgi:hypothetical protein